MGIAESNALVYGWKGVGTALLFQPIPNCHMKLPICYEAHYRRSWEMNRYVSLWSLGVPEQIEYLGLMDVQEDMGSSAIIQAP